VRAAGVWDLLVPGPPSPRPHTTPRKSSPEAVQAAKSEGKDGPWSITGRREDPSLGAEPARRFRTATSARRAGVKEGPRGSGDQEETVSDQRTGGKANLGTRSAGLQRGMTCAAWCPGTARNAPAVPFPGASSHQARTLSIGRFRANPQGNGEWVAQ